ncbi:hypothetical protein DPEC_G00222890 [Dallia pectoralis]|uniref:Uncharacterized protein n=1 Tax=Dallia pectoralis TaxID=75939 RepID=A0ACC2FZM0_DALPE|nr:hypothetical protein DPEC_G00222890 [Dallia pectoralis]
MLSHQLLNCFLTIKTICITFTGAADIVNAVKGHPVHLPCPLDKSYNLAQIQWTHVGGPNITCIYQVQNQSILNPNCDLKFNMTGQPPGLYLRQTESSDSGRYIGQITKILPPPTEYQNCTVDLQVNVPPNIILKKNVNSTCVRLLCTAEGLDHQDVNFTWNQTGLLKTPLTSQSLSELSSSLLLCPSAWSKDILITCNLSFNDTNLSTNIRILCSELEACGESHTRLIIICVIALIVVAVVAAVILTIYKCCQRRKNNGDSVTFTNKVYENFSFSTLIHERQRPARPTAEQCIYEN